jgi:uncharacterized Ntn-hydrolase superfamily protein
MTDVAVDLRVDDHPEPIPELRRLYDMHELLFGQTPESQWIAVDDELAVEMRRRLADRGYADESLEKAFNDWAGTENLEERVKGLDRVDPVVLDALRRA